ncbi:sporulation protein YhbH [Natroniella sp. ANB-PHB2]|uniref:sporulation protein YhbH n=1 Tax=Natroniella sp. ANB-PHB2 TaxID=3384444 RepID=UPI0038D3AC8E
MAIFREYENTGKDRSAEDRRRHRELIEDSIKKNISDIIAEESIIGKSKDKKIKVPIKGLKEYRFLHGINKPGVVSGSGEEKRGDKISKPRNQQGSGQGGTDQVGNEEGEDIYETEITIEELTDYLFEDLDLPYMERKKLSKIETESTFKKSGYKKKGIPPRLAKKRTMIERIKRKKAYIRAHDDFDEDERFPFHNEDLRYYRIKEEERKESNAVVICIMDTSASMNQTKKYLARSFYFLLYQFIQMKYQNVEIVFIAHTTKAKEVTEDDFFHKGESGGTYISSGYQKGLEIIEQRYDPAHWNIYCFHCSDGDNWSEDNQKALEYAQQLCDVCNLFGYGEIKPNYTRSAIKALYSQEIDNQSLSLVTISKKEDIWPSFQGMLESDREG